MGRSLDFFTLSQNLSTIRTSKNDQGTDRTHWKTTRVLKVQLVEEVPLADTEMLSDTESADLAGRYPGTGYRSTRQGND